MRVVPIVLALSGVMTSTQAAAQHAAQNNESATPVQGETVVIIGDRLQPFPPQVALENHELDVRRAAATDTASLLQNIPGVSVYGAGGVSSLPVIHGMADDRVRTLVDGMDLVASCPNHMNPALSYIDPSRAEQVRVFAGVTPVSLGGDSIAGTIVVDSREPQFAHQPNTIISEAQLGAFYRSNGHVRGANTSARFASEQLSIGYQGSITEAHNYKAADNFQATTASGRPGHTVARDEVGSTAYESTNHSVNLALRHGQHQWELTASRQNIPFQNFPNQRMDMTLNRTDQFNLRYHSDQQWGTLRAQIYHDKTEHEMDFGEDKRFWYGMASGTGNACSPISMTCAAGMPMYSEGKTTGIKLSLDFILSDDDLLRVGTEYLRYRLNDWWPPSGSMMWPGTFWNIRSGERDRHVVFGEWEAQRGEHWEISLGGRHEIVHTDAGDAAGYNTTPAAMGNQYADMMAFNRQDHQRRDQNWDVTALARYTPTATARYEFALAQKNRSPNLYERYTWSAWPMAAVMNNFVGDGNGYVGSLDLEPEVARTLSVSADWHDAGESHWNLTITPYHTWVENYIDAYCATGACAANQFNVLRFQNQSARLYGVDLSAQWVAMDSAEHGRVTLSASMDYTRGKNTSRDDNLYNIMPRNEKLVLSWMRNGWSAAFEAQHVAEKDNVSALRNEIATQSYSLYHLRAGYEWQQVRIDMGIENLFDKFHALPLGGVYMGQGTTMSMNGIPWGIAVPGPGRSLYTAVTFTF